MASSVAIEAMLVFMACGRPIEWDAATSKLTIMHENGVNGIDITISDDELMGPVDKLQETVRLACDTLDRMVYPNRLTRQTAAMEELAKFETALALGRVVQHR